MLQELFIYSVNPSTIKKNVPVAAAAAAAWNFQSPHFLLFF